MAAIYINGKLCSGGTELVEEVQEGLTEAVTSDAVARYIKPVVQNVTSGVTNPVSSGAVYGALTDYISKEGITQNIKLKRKLIKGTTNDSGIIYKGNSNLLGTETVISAYIQNINDIIILNGWADVNGSWLKVCNYNLQAQTNRDVDILIYYLDFL